MSSMRKAAAGPLSLLRPQHGSKWCLALAEAWLPNCSCTSSRQSKVEVSPFLHKTLRKEWAKEWDGEERSSCLCSALAGSVGLCCPVRLSWRTFVGRHRGGWKPGSRVQEHPLACWTPSCPFHPGVEPLEPDSSSMTPQSLTLRDVRLHWRLLAALPFPSCNPGELSISLTRE